MSKKIKPLEPPDNLHLQAAEGWLELGDSFEANEELEKISPSLRIHSDVLELRWQIYTKEKRWNAGADIARAITELAPGRVSGWIHLAYSLRRKKDGGLQTAWEVLLPVVEKFPMQPVVAYNLACYACQMKQMDAARHWIKRVFEIAGEINRFDEIRLMALDDSDLEPLWTEFPSSSVKAS